MPFFVRLAAVALLDTVSECQDSGAIIHVESGAQVEGKLSQ